MTRRDETFRYWYARDERTGLHATVIERVVGIERSTWEWRVANRVGSVIQEGTNTSQKGARAACRQVVRKLEPRAHK